MDLGAALGVLFAAITVLLGLATYFRQQQKDKREALDKVHREQEEALAAARLDGFNSRNDEVSLYRARLEDRDRDNTRLERQVEMLMRPVAGYQLPPVTTPVPPSQPPALPPSDRPQPGEG